MCASASACACVCLWPTKNKNVRSNATASALYLGATCSTPKTSESNLHLVYFSARDKTFPTQTHAYNLSFSLSSEESGVDGSGHHRAARREGKAVPSEVGGGGALMPYLVVRLCFLPKPGWGTSSSFSLGSGLAQHQAPWTWSSRRTVDGLHRAKECSAACARSPLHAAFDWRVVSSCVATFRDAWVIKHVI